MAKGGRTSKFRVDEIVYNKRTNTVGIVRLESDDQGITKTDADGNVNTNELQLYNPLIYKKQANAQVAPSTKREIDSRNLWKPFRKYVEGYRDWETDRKSTRLNSSHSAKSRMPSSA